MRIVESRPAAYATDKTLEVDPSTGMPSLGTKVNPCNSNGQVQLIASENLMSWKRSEVRGKGGQDLGVNLRTEGTDYSFRNEMALMDGDCKKPVAVCLKNFCPFGEKYKIYSTTPLYAGQKPSIQRYKQYTKLYTYCKVYQAPFSFNQSVTFDNKNNPSMTITRIGDLRTRKRVVKYRGKHAAFLENGTWDGKANSYLITVSPGIDPCLIVCLAAVCDKMEIELHSAPTVPAEASPDSSGE